MCCLYGASRMILCTPICTWRVHIVSNGPAVFPLLGSFLVPNLGWGFDLEAGFFLNEICLAFVSMWKKYITTWHLESVLATFLPPFPVKTMLEGNIDDRRARSRQRYEWKMCNTICYMNSQKTKHVDITAHDSWHGMRRSGSFIHTQQSMLHCILNIMSQEAC